MAMAMPAMAMWSAMRARSAAYLESCGRPIAADSGIECQFGLFHLPPEEIGFVLHTMTRWIFKRARAPE